MGAGHLGGGAAQGSQLTQFQTSLFGEDEVAYGRGDPVLAVDLRRYLSAMRVLDLHRLGYLVEPVLDPTYGPGGMWKLYEPERLVRGDIDASRGHDVQLDATALPFRDRAFGSVLFDPPFKMTHDVRHDRDDLTVRFNAAAGRYAILAAGVTECARVADRYLIVKCQDQTEGWNFQWQTGIVVQAGLDAGMHLHDLLYQVSSIPQPNGRAQRTARHNASTYVVLRKAKRRRTD